MNNTVGALIPRNLRLPHVLIILGMVALYGPSLVSVFSDVWSTDEQAHGPLVLGVALWLMYRQWGAMLEIASKGQPNGWGWIFLLVGLVAYVVGRSQAILLFEVGSVIWVLTGVGLLCLGTRAVMSQWFALFFMLFMIPLPGAIVDAVTLPMKTAVSYVADVVLFNLGYPISRVGVVLQVGQYQLLVADACAGLHTLFSLEALGLLYLNLMRHDSWFRNLVLATLIVPISFTANVIRVMALTLITYHFGDEAGQGFLHGFAGMVLFVSALLLIIAVDSGLQAIVRIRRRRWDLRNSGGAAQ